MSRTLLIDADIIAYQASASNESKIDWGDGPVVAADFEAAQRHARDSIDSLVATLDATDFILCLSDDVDNFRKDIYPAYKGNRTGERPVHLYDVKDWMVETFDTRRINRLEADDVMGIMSTEPHTGDRIIVSEDKDMQTVPGLLYNPNRNILGVREISPEEAERFLMWQAICGDQTDGYPGCPGSGPEAAETLLAGIGWESFVHTFKRGPRKGLDETRWRIKQMDRWSAIVSAYEKAGLSEADAIVQVNLARILTCGSWIKGRVVPWVPPALGVS